MPDYQQDSISNHYKGLKVNWLVYFRILTKHNENEVTLYLHHDKDPLSFPEIECKIKVDEFPFIKFARQQDQLWVKGEISELSRNRINLTNCTILRD